MKGRIIKNWSKVNLRDPEHARKVRGAFQHFMSAPDTDQKLKAAIQQLSTKDDFPTEILQVLEKFHATPDWDLGYEQIFDIRDFTGTNESGFEIVDVTSGLAFAKVPTGDKAKVYKMSGTKVTVSFDRYGGGLNWDRTWFDDNKFWQVEDTAIEFRNKAFSSRAAVFYALIEAIGSGQNLAWQGVTADSELERDIKTINQAALNILTAVKDKGFGANANSELVLLAPLALKTRINRALTTVQQAFSGSPSRIQYNVRPVYTLMLASTTQYYVTLPGRKSKGGYRQNLTLFNMFDILAYADTVAGWQRYGGAIGDVTQFQRCLTS